jgi:IclR family mhp operon transcriptional activator
VEQKLKGTLRTVSRAMEVLRALNRKGHASVLEISRMSRISRPALYRILDTLEQDGYVKREARGASYRLTSQVLHLSVGYRDQDWLTELVEPFLDRLQKQLVWPTDFATYEFGRMLLRDTTRRASPWDFDGAKVGLRLPVLHTSLGLAYLASLDDAGVQGVLTTLRNSGDPMDALVLEPKNVAARVAAVRKAGYALRPPGFFGHTNTIAVALHGPLGSLGALGVTFAASAVSESAAVKSLLPPLVEIRDMVAKKLAERRSQEAVDADL